MYSGKGYRSLTLRIQFLVDASFHKAQTHQRVCDEKFEESDRKLEAAKKAKEAAATAQ